MSSSETSKRRQPQTSAAWPTAKPWWRVDNTVDLPLGQTLVIDYDGSYWHADKGAIDTAKSLDLLAAGCKVVRLRESPLPHLTLEHDNHGACRVRCST